MAAETPAPADEKIVSLVSAEPAAPAGVKPADAVVDSKPKKKKSAGVPPRRGKKLRNQLKSIEKKVTDAGNVTLKQGVALLRTLKRAKFDETIEIHINLGIDPTQSDQMVRGSVGLPHGIGKSVRVAVFCQGDKVALAKAAGADHVGGADLVEKITKGRLHGLRRGDRHAGHDGPGFAARESARPPRPDADPEGRHGDSGQRRRRRGRQGIQSRQGGIPVRQDRPDPLEVGKMSFADDKLVDNVNAFVEAVRAAKPSGVKGNYINGIVLSATMSPGIRLSM